MSAFSESEIFDVGRLCALIGAVLAGCALALSVWRDARAANSPAEARFLILSSVIFFGVAFALFAWLDIGLFWLVLASWLFLRWQTHRRQQIASTQYRHWLFR